MHPRKPRVPDETSGLSVAICSAALVRMPALTMGSASNCLRKINSEPLLSLSKDCPATLIGLK
jgi:hypothetical protein